MRLLEKLFLDRQPERVLFRVDAGPVPGLSFGHLKRCTVLAGMARSSGCDVRFFMRRTSEGMATAREWGAVLVADSNEAVRFSPDAVIVDMPEDPELCWPGSRLFVIDDTGIQGGLFGRAEAILNSSVLAWAGDYPDGPRLLLGPDHFILDPVLASVSPRKKASGQPLVILLTFGGSDPTGLMFNVLPCLIKVMKADVEVIVHLGPGHLRGNELRRVVEGTPFSRSVTFVRAPLSMAPLYSSVDLCICAGGRSLYELTGIGMPCIAIGSTENEARVIEAFRERGVLIAGLPFWDESVFIQSIIDLNLSTGNPYE